MLDDNATPKGGVVGRVTEGPWGTTLASFALRRATGELVVRGGDGKEYRVAFVGGAIVAASSPLAIDSIARIALTSHVVTASVVPTIQKRLAAQSGRDEIDVVAELARLPVEHAVKLRRRAIEQRAARTFSLEDGAYRFEPTVTLPRVDGVDADVGSIVFLGVHANLSEARLAQDLARLGTRFALHPHADVTRFGFSAAELAVVESLRGGASLPELDAHHRTLAPRTQQAIVYALVACGACAIVEAPVRTPTPRTITNRPTPPRTSTRPPQQIVEITRSTTEPDVGRARTRSNPPQSYPAELARSRTRSANPSRGPTAHVPSSSDEPLELDEFNRSRTVSGTPLIPRTLTPRRNVFAVRETIAAGLALLSANADHYTLLGVERDARLDVIRSAYVAIASQLHRDKLPPVDADTAADAQRVFAAVSTAFGVLCDPVKRAEYTSELRAAGAARVDHGQLADTAYRHGLLALRREDLGEAIAQLTFACEHAPSNVDFRATLAWARFCASPDKRAIAPEVRKALQGAIFHSQAPVSARFYLGRVERMLGRIDEAVHHFREVLVLAPDHAEAASELRLLEPRSAGARRRS